LHPIVFALLHPSISPRIVSERRNSAQYFQQVEYFPSDFSPRKKGGFWKKKRESLLKGVGQRTGKLSRTASASVDLIARPIALHGVADGFNGSGKSLPRTAGRSGANARALPSLRIFYRFRYDNHNEPSSSTFSVLRQICNREVTYNQRDLFTLSPF